MGARFLRSALAGCAGGAAWILAMTAAFGPAQAILTNPRWQSAKMIAAFSPGPSEPRSYAAPAILLVGILGIAVLWGIVYGAIATGWSGSWWRRGLLFGLVAWVFMVPWFEFFLPWNVLHEPATLVALELVCWAVVLLAVGVAIAGTELLARRLLPDR